MPGHPLRRVQQAGRILGRDGVEGLARAVVRRAGSLLPPVGDDLGLRPEDIATGVPAAEPPLPGSSVAADGTFSVGWLMAPPAPGSGGHTTVFRMVEALEAAGHRCSLHLYDAYGGDVRSQEEVIRSSWPRVRATVHPVGPVLPARNAWVATSWQSAHVLATRPEAPGRRLYFVQDYEPWFHPHGDAYALAEQTYDLGFHGITAGPWLCRYLADRHGMQSGWFPFGADTDVYRARPGAVRDGVVFYAKPDVPRRAFQLGALALSEFSRRRPDVPIHLFGARTPALPFKATHHGALTPTAIDALYNTCRVGLSLSLTNVSLIPWELLASGVVPVVNDAEHNRVVLDNDHVVWSACHARALADSLERAYDAAASPGAAATLSSSVAALTWDAAAADVLDIITKEVLT